MPGKTDKMKIPVGERISRLRKSKKISLEELSERTGLRLEHLKNIEDGSGFAAVGDILKISKCLTVDPKMLFQSLQSKEKELRKKRIEGFRLRESSYNYTVLTSGEGDRLRAFRVRIPAGEELPKIHYQHEGEEFIYVMKGSVEITVGHRKHFLAKNETLHFNSGIRHSLRNPGKTVADLLVAIYTP
jgi:quercetin dioxygenase-like cupin family protein